MKGTFIQALEVSRSDVKPTLFKMVKLQEECGELAEAVLCNENFMPHKTMKEPLVGEVADVILVALDVYRASYPSLSDEELVSQLINQMETKLNKWRSIIPKK